MVMKYLKLILREIKSSKARFLSIAAMFALGVGFYSGLGSTMPVMKKSMDRYADDYNLYDIELVSEYGFDSSDADSILSADGVKNAVFSKSVDMLVNEGAARFMSVTDDINMMRVLEGRMPQNSGECIIGRNKMNGNIAQIGDTITLSADNSQDNLDMFKVKEFTVVGIAESPMFPSVQRGAAQVGQGVLQHYVYINESDFDTDYYTEAYIQVQGAKELQLYTQEYSELVSSVSNAVENSGIAQQQLDRVKSDSQSELDDAKAEYEENKQLAYDELDKAKAELDSAAAELSDAKASISDGEKQLANGTAEYQTKKAEAEQLLAQSQAVLDENTEKYNAALAEFNTMYQYLADTYGKPAADIQTAAAKAELESAKEELERGKTELEAAKNQTQEQLDAAAAEIENNRALLENAKNEYDRGLAEYNEGLEKYNSERQSALDELDEAEKEIADAQAEIDELSLPEIYVFTLDDNYGVNAFSQDAERVNNIAKVFPILFFVVAALVCLTTMTRMVDEQRTKIGTLSALGYGTAAIALHYLIYSCVAAFAGGIFGIALGNIVIPLVIFNTYTILYSLPSIVFGIDAIKALGAFAAALLLTAAVTLWAATDSLKSCAAQLMRPAAPKNGKKVILERVGFIWRRLSFTTKVTCRNILRYKKRFFMTVLGIAGCCSLLVTGFGLKDSISGMLPVQYGEIENFDLTVYLLEDTQDVRDCIEQNSDSCMFVQNTGSDAKSSSKSLECTLLIPQSSSDFSEFIDLHNRKTGQKLDFLQTGEAVIAEKLSAKLGLGVGDMISVKSSDGAYVDLTVSGIAENYIYNYVYMSAQTYESVFGQPPEYNQVFVKTTDPAAAGDNISLNENVASVMNTEDMMTSFDDIFDSLNGVVLLLIISACLLNFVVLYNLTNINIGERVREIATIKVLGFYPLETDSYIYRENVVLTAVGTALGLWLGIYMHDFVIKTAELDMIMFTRSINIESYIFSALLTFVFSAFVNLFMHFKLSDISMTESLKSIE